MLEIVCMGVTNQGAGGFKFLTRLLFKHILKSQWNGCSDHECSEGAVGAPEDF